MLKKKIIQLIKHIISLRRVSKELLHTTSHGLHYKFLVSNSSI